MRVMIPMKGLLEKYSELARLTKKIGQVRADLKLIEKTLRTPKFASEGPFAIVPKERDGLSEPGSAPARLVAPQTKTNRL